MPYFVQKVSGDSQEVNVDVYKRQLSGAKSQGIKQLMAGGGVALIGTQLVPLLSGLFG